MRTNLTSSFKKEVKFPLLENLRKPFTKPYPTLDDSTSQTMIYITNYELRDYQLQMTTAAVHYNTLISIPTGLGKTFIGAVLIANFHRWFPTGKIIFTTPSRPLLVQQMREIQKILKLQDSIYTEISGSIDPVKRKPKWQNCTIFFGTPQAIQNDIESGVCDVSQIVLIVIDEAHRAHGDYSYCKIVSSVASFTSFFRVVGLTATPGNYFGNVQDLIYNLLIEKIESDTCDKYKFKRKIEKRIIEKEPGFDTIKEKLNKMLEPLLIKMNNERLTNFTDPEKISKGMVAMWNKQTQSRQNRFIISKMIRILGLREKLEEYSIDIFDKSVREDGGHDISFLLKTSAMFLKRDAKMEKLKEIVKSYLISTSTTNSSSSIDDEIEYSPLTSRQIIIFSNYRLVVEEIVKNLTEIKVRCAAFVGQSQSGPSKGLNRSKQLKVMDLFKRKLISVLVSTSIGEEGLDIGDVDLIICYDIQKSLTRMVQRIGRTGRKRNGNVIFLINESSRFYVSCENNNENNYFEFSADNFLQSNMKYFDMFHSPIKMIPDKLEIIYKKIDDNNNNYEIKHNCSSNSPYLNEEEKCWLIAKFGTRLKYNPVNCIPIKNLMFSDHASNESKILEMMKIKPEKNDLKADNKKDNIIIKNENDNFFKVSSDDYGEEKYYSSEFSSFPSFLTDNYPVEDSFLNKNEFITNDSNDQNSPDGFSQISVRKNRIMAWPAGTVYEDYESDDCGKLNLHKNPLDNYIFETESFVSSSSEFICSSSDEYDEEKIESPTFVGTLRSSKIEVS